jgi:DNA-binding transcriptional ArsR family regulator
LEVVLFAFFPLSRYYFDPMDNPDQLFKAFADSTRLRLLNLLAQRERCGGCFTGIGFLQDDIKRDRRGKPSSPPARKSCPTGKN